VCVYESASPNGDERRTNRGTMKNATHSATHCNALQHTATHCNTLQHTLQHIPNGDTQHTNRDRPF